MVENGRLAYRRVSTGIVDKRGYAEILSGVSPTDMIVARPESSDGSLAAGKRVRTAFAASSVTPEP